MKILAFSPFSPRTLSGNVVTLTRLQKGLRERGHDAELVQVNPETTEAEALALVEARSPDVLHFYHAYKTGRLLPALSRWPSVLTASGTDLNRDIDHPDRSEAVLRALDGADRIVTYNRSLLAHRSRAGAPSKWALIPKGVLIGDAPFDLRKEAGVDARAFVVLQSGGIRDEKNNLYAVEALSGLTGDFPDLRLVFAGPILDEEYGRRFNSRIQGLSWVRHLPPIQPEAMAAVYRGADLILNTSRMEGISNALMEAMCLGVPVVASDVPGNRDLIENGRTGFLYRDGSLPALLRELIRAPHRRSAAGAAAAEHARETFSTERELDAMLRAYEEARRTHA